MRPAWQPGDKCPSCGEPIWLPEDIYKPHRRICKPCGQAQRNEKRREKVKELIPPCRGCGAAMNGHDRRYGACKACRDREVAAIYMARECASCGVNIGKRSRNARFCDACCSRARSKVHQREVPVCACGSKIDKRSGKCRPCALKDGQASIHERSLGEATRIREEFGGEYRVAQTRWEAWEMDRANDDPARAAHVDAILARRGA